MSKVVTGDDKVIAGLKLFDVTVHDEISKATKASLQRIAKTAKANVARSPGKKPAGAKHLRATIKGKLYRDSKVQGYVKAGGKGARHAHLVELGTQAHDVRVSKKRVMTDRKTFFGKRIRHPGSQPHPFLRPAREQEAPNYESAVKQILVSEINKANQ